MVANGAHRQRGVLPFFVVRLFGSSSGLLFRFCRIGLGLFLRGLLMYGFRGSVAHIDYLSLVGLLFAA